MLNKNPLSYTKTTEIDKNIQQPELLQKDFRNVELTIENNKIEELKRKIHTITTYFSYIFYY